MSEIDTTLNIMFKSANLMVETVNTALNVLMAIMPKTDVNPEQTAWNKAIKDGNIDVLTCKNENDKEQLLAKLEENSILFKCYGDMIFTFNNDRDKVNELCQSFSDERTINEVIESNNNKGFIELNIESETDVENFMNRLDFNNINYTVIHSLGDEDKHKIIMSDSDYDVLNRIKIDVAIDKVDKEYNNIITRENIKSNEYKLIMLNKIGLINKDSDFIIADSDGTTIHGNSKFMTINKDGITQSRILNSRTNEYEKVMKSFCEMKCPTLLSKEEYNNFIKAENKQDFLIDCRREQGIGVLLKEEIEIVLKHEKEREMITQKLIQSHPEENVVDLNDYNCQQSFICFKESEIDNYEFNHDKSESIYDDANFLNDAYMEYVGYDIIESTTDYKGLSEIEERIFNSEERDKKLEELGINIGEIDTEIETDKDFNENELEHQDNEEFELND